MLIAESLLTVLLAGSVAAQTNRAPLPTGVPLPAAPVGLEGIGIDPGALGIGLQPLEVLQPLGRTFDGLRSLPSAPETDTGATPPPASRRRPIPEARRVAFRGIDLPAYAFSFRTRPSVEIKKALDHAESEMWLALHGLSIESLADAIVAAKARWKKNKVQGPIKLVVNVDHMFPKGERGRSPELERIFQAREDGVLEIRVVKGTGPYGTMHNKVAILDRALVEFGSFNWSDSADTVHNENIKFRSEAPVIDLYRAYYEWLWSISTPVDDYKPGDPPANPDTAPPADPNPDVLYAGEKFPKAVFSPNGGVMSKVERAIRLSDEAVHSAMFALFSKPIAEALAERRASGVDVRLVLDKSQGRRSPEVRWLLEQGVPIRWQSGHGGRPGEPKEVMAGRSPEQLDAAAAAGVMHNKYGVFRSKLGAMLELGSFNWTTNGDEHNFENANFTTDAQDVEAYDAWFEKLWEEGEAARMDEFLPEAFVPPGTNP